MKFKYDSNVHNSLEEVWAFVIDFSKRPDWIHFFDESFISHQADSWVGTKYKEKLTFLGIPLFIEYVVTDYKEQSYIYAKSNMPPFFPKVNCEVRDNGDGTIYSSLEFDIKLGAFSLVPKKIIQKQVDKLVEPLIAEYVRILDKPSS